MKIGNIKKDNYELIIKHSETDDFSQLLIINGLYPRNGGTPIQYVLDKIVPGIREKLVRKYKTIKPADIKNKLKIFLNIRFFQGLEFTSQEKIEISNDRNSIDNVLGNIDWDKVVRQLLKDEDLMLAITEYFSLKEKAKENAELKKLSKNKTKKRIVDDNYLPAIGKSKITILSEGLSAHVAISNILGRQNKEYIAMGGVPMNIFNEKVTKVATSKKFELISKVLDIDYTKSIDKLKLYEIKIDNKIFVLEEDDEFEYENKTYKVKDYNSKKIENNKENIKRYYETCNSLKISNDLRDVIIATDADLPGIHIRGLMMLYFYKYYPKLIFNNKLKLLKTPLVFAYNKNKLVNYFFDFETFTDYEKENPNYIYEYTKGLGTLDKNLMKKLFDKDMNKFIENINLNDIEEVDKTLELWFDNKTSNLRKEEVKKKEFNINML